LKEELQEIRRLPVRIVINTFLLAFSSDYPGLFESPQDEPRRFIRKQTTTDIKRETGARI
jgi:hypothetical protein